MELKKIQYFLRIVECGSLSKAAESLYLTQPTLSKFLARLEDEAGVKMFLRLKDSSLRLTEAGEEYLHTAMQINELWCSLESSLEALRKNEACSIRLGIDSETLYSFAQSCADSVIERYPSVHVDIFCLPSRSIQAQIAEGSLDLGLASYSRFNESLRYRIFDKTEIDLAVSRINPLSAYSFELPGQEDRTLSLNDLAPDTPFLLYSEQTVMREIIDSYMQKMHFTPSVPNTYSRPEFLGEILSVKESLVAFCPRSHIFSQVAHIALDPPLIRNRGICFHKNKELRPPEKLLADLLCTVPAQRLWDGIATAHSI